MFVLTPPRVSPDRDGEPGQHGSPAGAAGGDDPQLGGLLHEGRQKCCVFLMQRNYYNLRDDN